MRYILKKFAEEMETILTVNDYKGGWGFDQCDRDYLEDRLMQEIGEYFKSRDAEELIDIANLAMMLWSRTPDRALPLMEKK